MSIGETKRRPHSPNGAASALRALRPVGRSAEAVRPLSHGLGREGSSGPSLFASE